MSLTDRQMRKTMGKWGKFKRGLWHCIRPHQKVEAR